MELKMIPEQYVQDIAIEFIYNLRQGYLDKLIDLNNDNFYNDEPAYDMELYKEFNVRLDDFRDELVDCIADALLRKGFVYYDSNAEYEDDEECFGVMLEELSMNHFGKDIKSLLNNNFSIQMSIDSKSTTVNTTKIVGGNLECKTEKIENQSKDLELEL